MSKKLSKYLLVFLISIFCLCFVVILTIKSVDANTQSQKVVGEPIITLDTKEYDLQSVPNAVLNKPYRIFDGSAVDIYGNQVVLIENVWLHTYSSTKSKVSLVDGCFFPQYYGEYMVEYTAVDADGNTSTIAYSVACQPKEEFSITIGLDTVTKVFDCGVPVNVADYFVENQSGNVSCSIIARLQGGDVEYEINSQTLQFIPMQSGTYSIVYNASDYNESCEKSYDVVVNKNTTPVIFGEAKCPSYMLLGASYSLDLLDAAHFADGKKSSLSPIIRIKYSDLSEEILTGATVVPKVAGKAQIDYIAKYGNEETVKSYFVEIVDVNYTDVIDMSKYFATKNATSVEKEDGVSLSTMQEGATATFINPITSREFDVKFFVTERYSGLEELNIYLTAEHNTEKKIKLSIEKEKETSMVSINDGKKFTSSASFLDSSNITVLYNDENKSISINGKEEYTVGNFLNGQEFTGFGDEKCYISWEFERVSGQAEILISKIKNQTLGKDVSNASPFVLFELYQGGVHQVGDFITIQPVYLGDVLDPNYTVDYWIETPTSGEYAVSVDGVLLNRENAKHNHEYVIQARQNGYYSVYIQAKDEFGPKVTLSYSIVVSDTQSPNIYLIGDVEDSCQLGDTIRLKDAVTNDNVSLDMELLVYVYSPSSELQRIQIIDGYEGYWFKPKEKGKHMVYYYIFDEAGNRAMQSYTFIVD